MHLSKRAPVIEVRTEELFDEPEAVLRRLGLRPGEGAWSADEPLPFSNALTGHPSAMQSTEWVSNRPRSVRGEPCGRLARPMAKGCA